MSENQHPDDSCTVFRTGREIEREIQQLQLEYDGLSEGDAYARLMVDTIFGIYGDDL